MIKNLQKQRGSAHVIIMVVLAIGLIAAIGFIFYQNFIQKTDNDTADTTSSAKVDTKTPEPTVAKTITLAAGSFDGQTGTFQARGHIYTVSTQQDPYCQSDCKLTSRAFLYIDETPNTKVAEFIKGFAGNSFVADSAVALGCVVDGKIQADGTPSGKKVYGTDVSSALIKSSKEIPVAVEVTRSKVPTGQGASVCYSHFDNVTLLQ